MVADQVEPRWRNEGGQFLEQLMRREPDGWLRPTRESSARRRVVRRSDCAYLPYGISFGFGRRLVRLKYFHTRNWVPLLSKYCVNQNLHLK